MAQSKFWNINSELTEDDKLRAVIRGKLDRNKHSDEPTTAKDLEALCWAIGQLKDLDAAIGWGAWGQYKNGAGEK